MKKILKWAALGFVGLVILGAIIGGGGSNDSGSGDSAKSASGKSDSGKSGDGESSCGIEATDDCTPRVRMGRKVRVDALIWDVTAVEVKDQIGDTQYGLGEKADGRFVVVSLTVHSDRDESATITSEQIKLDIGGNTYDPDLDGTIAAMGEGAEPLWYEDIGPDSTVRSMVVFDVPPSKLRKKLALRFGELGFGETHGYIEIPSAEITGLP